MEVGTFVNTPAHAHLYREFVNTLERRGHHATVFARDDSCTLDILDFHDISYHIYGERSGGRTALAKALPGHLRTIARLLQTVELDLVFGMGVYSTYAGGIAGVPAIAVMDSEPMAFKQRLTAPLVTAFLTPESFRRNLGRKHYTFRGFKETAYLHPDVYRPAGDIRRALDLDADDRFSVVRFNAFHGHHDVGVTGFSTRQKRALLERLAEHGIVFVSDEHGDSYPERDRIRAFDAHPALIHDALAEADILIADTQTMVTEAALLGTPAIRSNSFVGPSDMGNFGTLERAGLVYNLRAFDAVMERIDALLADPTTRSEWAIRREGFLAEQCNLTAILAELVEDAATHGSVRDAIDRCDHLTPAATRDPHATIRSRPAETTGGAY